MYLWPRDIVSRSVCKAILWTATAAFFFGETPLWLGAQLTLGSISGTVKDSTGAIAPGAQITVRNQDTGNTRTLQSNAAGLYVITNLGPGQYEVRAELGGFQTEVRQGIALTLGRDAVVDFTLQVGQVEQQVIVTGDAPLVDTTSAAMAGLVEQQQVADLPLNARSLTQLAHLQLGVISYRVGTANALVGGGDEISIGGARTRQINYLLNGTSILNMFGKSPGGVTGNQLGAEAVREFSVLTNSYSAEFGKSAGGVINAVTKSGTNTFHGSLFEYLRNDNLDAAQWEANALAGGVKPEFKRNQFGGSLGGPIRRDQTFFFVNVEFLRDRSGSTSVNNVPTEAARQGIVPGQPPITVHPGIKPFLDLIPLPNGEDLRDGRGFHVSVSNPLRNQSYFSARLDHRFSDSDSVFGSFTVDRSVNTGRGGTIPSFFTSSPFRTYYATLQQDHIVSPTVLNSAHVGFNRSNTSDLFECGEVGVKLNFTGLPGYCPRLQSTGTTVPSVGFGPKIYILNSFQYSDTLTWTRGNHTVKFGGRVERIQVNGESPTNPGGLYSGRGNLAAFLRGDFSFFEAPIPGGDSWRGMREAMFAFFANDDVRVRSNLTLNLGLRYEFIIPASEVNGKLANTPCVLCQTQIVDRLFENPSLKNFSPRIGVAWSPGGSRKTSVRAGFGIFYDQILHHQWITAPFRDGIFFSEGRVTPARGTILPFPNVFQLVQAGQFTQIPSFLSPMEGNPAQPYNLQYNLTVQQQLPGEMVVQVGYVGAGGRHLPRLVDNIAFPTIQDGRYFFPTTSVRRNPGFGEMRLREYSTSSSYNALQVGVRRRMAQGVGFQVSYTWSKTIDMMSDIAGAGDLFNDTVFSTLPEDPAFDRARSGLDTPHNFIANFSADVPFGNDLSGVGGKILGGWQTQGIVRLQAGFPVNLDMGFDAARMQSSRNMQRPNLNPSFTKESVVLGVPNKTKDPRGRYFDPTAFSLPEPGFLGNLGRNVFSGPGMATVDFSLIKKTPLTEALQLEFRSEFFNLFNRPNFSYPNSTVFNAAGQTQPLANFGRITGTRTTGRQIQFALRLTF